MLHSGIKLRDGEPAATLLLGVVEGTGLEAE